MPFDNVRFKECSVINDEYASGKYVFGTLGKLFARILIRFPITPNQLTWFWGGLMVISSLLYSTGKWEFSILGGIIWIIAYSLDYSDGIIARYKNKIKENKMSKKKIKTKETNNSFDFILFITVLLLLALRDYYGFISKFTIITCNYRK